MTEPPDHLLARLFEGDELGDDERGELEARLATPEGREEALAWMREDAALASLGTLLPAENAARAKGRVLAEGVLREKRRALEAQARRRALRRRAAVGVAAAAAIATLIVWRTRPPELAVSGDAEVLRVLPATNAPTSLPAARGLRRGDVVKAGAGGATLSLGGYCRLQLGAGSELAVAGAPGSEAIQLRAGRVDARVTPGRGGFRIDTPLGTVEVVGTEFTTSVEPRGSGAATTPVVQVAVREGKVACRFEGRTDTLGPGERRIYGGPQTGETAGRIVSVSGGAVKSVKIDVGGETLEVESINDESARDLASLFPGDTVTVSWTTRDGQKLVTQVVGRLRGRITQVGPRWIELAPDRGGSTRRFAVPWRGGMPSAGGGPDARLLAIVQSQRVGAHVEVAWALLEGRRVLDITPLSP